MTRPILDETIRRREIRSGGFNRLAPALPTAEASAGRVEIQKAFVGGKANSIANREKSDALLAKTLGVARGERRKTETIPSRSWQRSLKPCQPVFVTGRWDSDEVLFGWFPVCVVGYFPAACR